MQGLWMNYYTGKEVDMSIGIARGGSLSVDPSQNCGLLIIPWQGWSDWQCQVATTPITCACEHPGQMYLQLRGLCPSSNIDRFYVPRNKKRSGAVQLLGLDTTIIEYNKNKLSWAMMEYSQNTTSLIIAPLASYVLGSHEWLIENDNEKCSTKGEAYKRILKLTGCRDGEFTCNDGQCIR